MTLLAARRRVLNLALDALFVAWVAQILITGDLVPSRLAELLNPQSPVAVVIEPGERPLAPVDLPLEIADRTPAEA